MGGSDSKLDFSDKQERVAGEGQKREFSVEGQFKEDLFKDREAGYMSEEDGYEARCHSYIEGEIVDNASFSLSDDDEFGSTYDSRNEAAQSLLGHPIEASASNNQGESSPQDEDYSLPISVMKSLEQIDAREVLCSDSFEKPFPVIASATSIREKFVHVELDVVTKDGMFVSRDDSPKRTDNEQFPTLKCELGNVQLLQGTSKVCISESVSKFPSRISAAEECKQWKEIPPIDKVVTTDNGTNENDMPLYTATNALWKKANKSTPDVNADEVATDENVIKNAVTNIDRNTGERAIEKNIYVLDKNASEESFGKNARNIEADEGIIGENVGVIDRGNEDTFSKNVGKNSIGMNTEESTIDKQSNATDENNSENTGEVIIDKSVDKGSVGSNISFVCNDSINVSDKTFSKNGGEIITGCNNDKETVANSVGIVDKNTCEEAFSKNADESAVDKNADKGIVGKNIGGKNIIDKNIYNVVDQCCGSSYSHDDIVIARNINENTLAINIDEVSICKSINEGSIGKNINIICSSTSGNAIEKSMHKSSISKKTNDGGTSELSPRIIAGEKVAEENIVDRDASEEDFSKNTNDNIVGDRTNEETIGKNRNKGTVSENTGENIIQINVNEYKFVETICQDAEGHVVRKTDEATMNKDTVVNISSRNAGKVTYGMNADDNVIDGSAKESTVDKNTDDITVDDINGEENICKCTEEGAIDKNIDVILIDKNASRETFCENADENRIDRRTNESAISKNPYDAAADKNIIEQTESKNLDDSVFDKNAEKGTLCKTSNDTVFSRNINDGKNINEIAIAKNANDTVFSESVDELIFDHNRSEKSVCGSADKGGIDKNAGEIIADNISKVAIRAIAGEKTAEKKIFDRDASEEAYSKYVNDAIVDDSANEGTIGKDNDEGKISKTTGKNSVKTNIDKRLVNKSTNGVSEEAISKTVNQNVAHKNSSSAVISGNTIDNISGRSSNRDATSRNTKENIAQKNSNEASVSKNTDGDIDRSSDKSASGKNANENIVHSEAPISKNTNDKIIDVLSDKEAIGKNIDKNIAHKNSNDATVSKNTDDIDRSYAAGRNTNENIAHTDGSEAPVGKITNDSIDSISPDKDANIENNDENLVGNIANCAVGKNTYKAIPDMKVSGGIGSMSMDEDIISRTADKSCAASEHYKITQQCIAVEEILVFKHNDMCKFPEKEQEVCVDVEDRRSDFQCKTVSQNGSSDRYQDAHLSTGDESLSELKSIDLSTRGAQNSESKEALVEKISSAHAVESGKDLIIEGDAFSFKDGKGGVCREKEVFRDAAVVADIGVPFKESIGSKVLLSLSKSESGNGLVAVNVAGNTEMEKCGSRTDSTISCKETPPLEEGAIVKHKLSEPSNSDSMFIIEGKEIHVVASGDKSADTPVTSIADFTKDSLPDSPSKLTIRLIERPSAFNSGVGSDIALSGKALVEHTKKTMDQILKSGLADALLPTNLPDTYKAVEKFDNDNASMEKDPVDSAKTLPTSGTSQTSKSEILSLNGSSIARDPVFKFISSLLENQNAKVVSSSSNSTVIVISPNDEGKGETRNEGGKHELKKSERKEAKPLNIEGGLSIVLDKQESSRLADIMAVQKLGKPNIDLATSVATGDSVARHSPIANATALGASGHPFDRRKKEHPDDKRKSSAKPYNASKKRVGWGIVSSPKIPHKKKKEESTHKETVNKQIETNIVCLPDKNLKVNYVPNSKSNSTVSILADNEGLSVSKSVAKRMVYRDISRGGRRHDHGKVDEAKIDWLEKQFLSQNQANNEKIKQYYDALKRSLLLRKKSRNITASEKEARGNILQSLKSLSVKNLALIRATQAIGEECTYKDVENVLKSIANCAQGDVLSSKALNKSSAVVDDTVNGSINIRKSTEKLRKIVTPVCESKKIPAASTSTVFRSRNSSAKYRIASTNFGTPEVVNIPSRATKADYQGCEVVRKLSAQIGGNASLLRDGPGLIEAQATAHVYGSHLKQTLSAAVNDTSTSSKSICSPNQTRGAYQIRHERHNIDNYGKTSIIQDYKLEAGERAQALENEKGKHFKDGHDEVVGDPDGDEDIEKANIGGGNKRSASSSQTSKLVETVENEKSFQVLKTVSEAIVQSSAEKNDTLARDQKVKLCGKSSAEFELVSQRKCHDAIDDSHSLTEAKERAKIQVQGKLEKVIVEGNVYERGLTRKQSSKDMISNIESSSGSLAKGIAKHLFVAEKKSILKSMFSKAKKEINTRVAESMEEQRLQDLDKQAELKSFESNLLPGTVRASSKEVSISESEGSKVGSDVKSQKSEVGAISDGCMPKVSSPGKCIVGNVISAKNSAYVASDMSKNNKLDNGVACKIDKGSLASGSSALVNCSVKDNRGSHPLVYVVQNNPVSASSMKFSDNVTSHIDQKVGNSMHGGLIQSPRYPQGLRRLLPKSNALCVATLVEHLRKPDVKLALDGMKKLNQGNIVHSNLLGPQFNLVYSTRAPSSAPVLSSYENKPGISLQTLNYRRPVLTESRTKAIQNSTSKDSDILAIREVKSLLRGLESPETTDMVLRETKTDDTASDASQKNHCVIESDLGQKKPAVVSRGCARSRYVDSLHGRQYSNALNNVLETRKRKLSSTGSFVEKEKFTSEGATLHSFAVKQGKCCHKGKDGNAPSKSDESILYLEMAIRSIASKNLHLGSSPQLVSKPGGISGNFLSTRREAIRDNPARTSSRSSKLVASEAGAQGLKMSRDLASLSWRNIRYNRTLIGRKRTLLDSTATQFSWECLHFFDGRKLRHDRPSIINKLQKHDIKMQRIGEHYGYLRQRTCLREESKESGRNLSEESTVEKETSPTSLRATASKCPVFSQPNEGNIEKKCKAYKLLSEKAKRLSEPVVEKSPSQLNCKDEAVKIEKMLLDLTKESEDRCSIDSSSARQLTRGCQTSVPPGRLRARPSRIPKDCACSNVVKSIKGTAFENSIGGLARSIIRQVRKRKSSSSEENVCSKCNKVLESAKELTRHMLYHLIDKAVDCSFDDDTEERKAKRRRIMDFDLNRKEEESDVEKNRTASYDMVYVGTNESIEVQENSQVRESQIYKAQFWTKERISCTTGGEDSSHATEAHEDLSNDNKALWTPVYFDVPVKPLKWQCLKCWNKYNSIRELKLHADACGKNVAEKEIEELS